MSADQVFTELEKTRLKTLFDRIDSNHDGLITAAELKSLLSEFGREITDERANELIAKCDPQGTGHVDWERFCIGVAVVLVVIKAAIMLIALFKAADTDNSGFITASDLKKLAKEAEVDVPESKIDELISKCDQNGDGQISFREFIQALIHFIKSRA